MILEVIRPWGEIMSPAFYREKLRQRPEKFGRLVIFAGQFWRQRHLCKHGEHGNNLPQN